MVSVFSSQYSVFSLKPFVPGALYLTRLVGFSGVFLGTYSLVRAGTISKKLVLLSLVSCAVFHGLLRLGSVLYFSKFQALYDLGVG